jgi:hypothetical protein
MHFPKFRFYTQANASAPVVTLAADERVWSVWAEAGGSQDMTLAVALNNVVVSDLITIPVGKNLPTTHFEGLLHGPGTLTFANPGKYLVVTVREPHLEA